MKVNPKFWFKSTCLDVITLELSKETKYLYVILDSKLSCKRNEKGNFGII